MNKYSHSQLSRLTLSAAVLLSVTTAARADLLYHFPFENAAGEKSLANTGKVGGDAAAKSVDGIESEFTRNTPSGRGYALSFPMSGNGQGGPRLVLPQSEGKLLLNKPDQAMTIAVWLKWRGPDKHPSFEQGIVNKLSSNSKTGWSFVISDKGNLAFMIGGIGQRFSAGTVPLNLWTHVAMTLKTNGGLRFYINGQDTPLTMELGPVKCLPNDDFINVAVQGQEFYLPVNGALDDLRIYDEALPADDIEMLVKESQPASAPAVSQSAPAPAAK